MEQKKSFRIGKILNICQLKEDDFFWDAITQLNIDDTDRSIMCINLSAVTRQYESWERMFAGKIAPFFAMKANPDLEILKCLAGLGSGFDCASQAEIEKILQLGVSPDRIIFTHPSKSRSDLRFAKEHHVRTILIESASDMRMIQEIHPDAELLLRLRVEAYQGSAKFGAHRSSWVQLILNAKRMNLNLIGFAFHVVSAHHAIGDMIDDAKTAFEIAFAEYPQMRILDIGGGFPSIDEKELKEIVAVIQTKLPYFEDRKIKVVAEPGRFFVENCVAVITKICSMTEWILPNEQNKNVRRLVLSDGKYGSFRDLAFREAHIDPPKLISRTNSRGAAHPDIVEEESIYSIFCGPSSDPRDVILQCDYKKEIQEGDFLAWKNMGAYRLSVACEFNGFPLPFLYYYHHYDS